jgi:hypothetical protein
MSMDPYLGILVIGIIGLSVMAFGGLGRHGHTSHGGHGLHGGHGHGGGHAHGHGPGHGVAAPSHGAVAHVHGAATHGHGPPVHDSTSTLGLVLMSPRFFFAWLIGVGMVGTVMQSWLGGVLLATVALVGGVVFERLLFAPLWNLALRFASAPALTLESALDSEATAVSSFDQEGHGLVALEVDGQVVQLLGTLLPADRERGVKVRSGERVRVEEIDTARNRCIVSRL